MLEQIAWSVPGHPSDWNDAHHASFEKFSRYKTTAERSFLRNYKELEAHYYRILRDSEARVKSCAKMAAIELKSLTKREEKALAELKVRQYVEVEIIDGKTQTSCYPSSEELAEKVAALPEPPLYVKRWIEFLRGIPEEYAWADPAGFHRFTPVAGIQRMKYEDWLRLVEREKAAGSGHLSPRHTLVVL